MYDYKIVEQVSRKKKTMSGVLRKDNGNICLYLCESWVLQYLRHLCWQDFCLAASLFCLWIFSARRITSTPWKMDQLTIDVIYGKKYRKNCPYTGPEGTGSHCAATGTQAVAKYKKNGGTEQLKKYRLYLL